MINYWTKTGRYFGYPECCIRAFVERVTRGGAPPETTYSGTGFIPCENCKDKPVEDLIKGRQHSKPFPEADMKEFLKWKQSI